ncbi:MAG TPA: M3 family oligoendopeptidase [Fimbriimonadaceae bacterium]|nr:M3 family oligoendopeptidase [Fimbriimonadaceae bacterium]
MSSKTEIRPPQVRWDLSALFASLDDPRIEQSWQEALERADRFDKRYRGRIEREDLEAKTLAEALIELEDLVQQAYKPVHYAHLLHACDTGNPKLGAFLQKQMELSTELSVKLMFFELELQAAPEKTIAQILEQPEVANYRHYIQVARAFSPYRLSEPEEIILEEVSNTGDRAWKRLFEELVANHTFRLKRPDSEEVEELTEPEVLDLLRDPDRRVRQAAADSLTEGLKEMERVLVFVYNNLLQDKKVEDKLRKLPYPEHSRHLSNELDKETVDLVMRLCREHYALVERFYNVKREILGLPELTHIDRYAPLSEADELVDYDRARSMILEAFGEFSDELRNRADEFFQKQWIDAEPRAGKRGGAFCSYNTPDTHPVVFLSYLNKMDNVMTLAHELGHGVHASLSRAQSYFNFHGTLPLAELASTFGEMLVFEKLVEGASPKDRLALYAEKIEGVFATVFRQAAMFRFEQRCHEKRRTEGELTPEEFGDIWHEELQAMFGNSVQLGEQHRMWWSYVSHFISVPFYVYAYSFGELLVLSLYQMAKDAPDRQSFADRYVELLRLGGSRSPQELMETVGIDLRSEVFWRRGFAAMEKLVAEFERIWSEVRP